MEKNPHKTKAVLLIFFSPFASQSPDGLERVAKDKGFLHKCEAQEIFRAPIPDYTMPSIKHKGISTSMAGLIGTFLSFGVAFCFGYLMKRKKKNLKG